ncbi:FkbM family methyltransferase [Bradyrhizobium symbiodeficiens]|uniref:FkbM family methyltransferase n=1 Tax=Bradyrhizobium symbiodeficiens TaxID=1404367 RepID=UPI00140F9AE0|nr:FkbM family methyltransferase [Bradyrhizobium symbiodeficiens]QIO98854.1 FkbM family methyltransferase [Bradyrhizobium symbiodeficiens]
MSIIHRISTNLKDLVRYGPRFLMRHAPRLTGAETAKIHVSGQAIHVRVGESDIDTVRGVFGSHQYDISHSIPSVEDRVNRRYQEIIASGRAPVVVDAGANIGAASLWFKKQFPASIVVAVEPDTENFRILAKNAELADEIIPVRAAIGAEPGFVHVVEGELGWASRVERSSSGLPIITMRKAFDYVPNGVPFIAKIDIEGFEKDLFSNNTEWLADVFVVHIEPHDWMLPGAGSSFTFQRALAAYAFEIFIAGEILTYIKLL